MQTLIIMTLVLAKYFSELAFPGVGRIYQSLSMVPGDHRNGTMGERSKPWRS